ncbi:hypothetical protein KFK09_013280 [Dendrobium nobile]|uniref:Uncharacterized protein n=1 Tax=Dendrobium nobile TaxID=94219 RepID=A0A8T3BCN5_DENNO|nr:hypothetical protein KFK09_013280 [Dendrobium nobile]
MGDCGFFWVVDVPGSLLDASASCVLVTGIRTIVFGSCFCCFFICWLAGGFWVGILEIFQWWLSGRMVMIYLLLPFYFHVSGMIITGYCSLYFKWNSGNLGTRLGEYSSCFVFAVYFNLNLFLRKVCRFCNWKCYLQKVCLWCYFYFLSCFFLNFCREAMPKVFKNIWLLLFWVLFSHSPILILYYFCISRLRILRLVGFLLFDFDIVARLSSRELEEPPKDFVTVFLNQRVGP